jgi:hypothetical protein
MGKQVRIEFTSPGAEDVLKKFDALTRKEQEAILAGSKLGAAMSQVGTQGRKAGDEGAAGMAKWAMGAMGMASALDVVNKGLAVSRAELQRIVDLNKQSAQTRVTYEQARGNFIMNNQASMAADKGLLGRMDVFAAQQGAGLGAGGTARVLQGITNVRSAIGSGATEQEQLSAVARAVEIAKVDPAADVGSQALAILRVMKGLKLNQTRSSNVVAAFGEQAGGDINDFVGQFGKLGGVAEGTGTSLADVLALEGFLSQKMGTSAEETTTLVASALGKLKMGDIRANKKKVTFKSQNLVDRLLELSERVQAGEFGDDATEVLSKAGLEGARGPMIVGAMTSGREQLAGARRAIGQAAASDADFLAEAGRQRGPAAAIIDRQRGAAGEREQAELSDIGALKRAAAAQIVEAERDRLRMGPLTDPWNMARSLAVNMGLLGDEGGKKSVGAVQSMYDSGLGFLVNPVGAIVKLLERIAVASEGGDKQLKVRPEE